MIAVTSVVSARFMANYYADHPEGELTSVVVGVAAGLVVGLIFGLINGVGVARFKVSPFIMTLGMGSIGSGFALYYTGGSPVSGMPPLFTKTIGTGRWNEIPIPIFFAIAATILVALLVTRPPGDAISTPSAATPRRPSSPASRSGSTPRRSTSSAAFSPRSPASCSRRASRPASRTWGRRFRWSRSRRRSWAGYRCAAARGG